MRTLLAASLAIAFIIPCAAQEDQKYNLAGFDIQGSTAVGYRFSSIGGRQEKFMELFNLRSGPRLFDFNFSGRANPGASKLADSFQITASGLGGDPFPGGQLTVSKSKVYDLRTNFRQSYYYFDRNDDAALPSGRHALTTNHNWATVRRFGSINLLIHASNRLKFRMEYGKNSRDGINNTTRTMEYFGSPSAFGAFLRDNPYYVYAPIRDRLNKFAGGLDYTISDWSFHYTLSYQNFDQSMNWNNAFSPERSINIDSAMTAKELLQTAAWSESRNLKTPSGEFFYNGKVNGKLTLRGSILYFRFHGPANLDASFIGSARTTGTATAPYTIAMSSAAKLTEPNLVVDQGFTVKITSWFDIHGDYRYNRYTINSTAEISSLRDSTTSFKESLENEWRQGMHQVDLNLEFRPFNSLILRPGVRFIKRDTTVLEDGTADPQRSVRNKTIWPIASLAYVPSSKFSARMDVQSITSGTTYTRITPHTDVGTRLAVRYRPLSQLSIENSVVTRNRTNLADSFSSRVRSNASTISWSWNEHLSTYAGFSYDSFLATASVNFLRGTAPLKTSWRDQTVNRVWQLGVATKPMKRLGINFNGNFVRSTGAGEISGELPIFGALSWPMATGSVYYDFPRLGRLTADLQRTYYFEEIVRGNDFGANLLMVRWTKAF
ncbi:MAG: hypothetical protein A2831_01400 [Candidatus Yanofskybacteria bacterium RIFCSPHIGHO2_01_FULL_44_17]|uniref:Porin n=1 Tax=Candidatus Yanofskybacteria bacterium RIFCSPHIGHO2_01_FULL_44_17 TaxID=1802668 RepID=A0A1F8EZC4_9BACT|nr:MAG: hypothetical protein A2831_01400 [Candidatus Yanofskybacteria bacterium RIFCSPHIGHO2_01_FULL_44_17]